MKSLFADARSGEVTTCEVPAPELRGGGILVRTAFSAISAGTERSTLATGRRSLLGKAVARPDLVRQVLDYARANGVRAAYQRVQARLETHTALGYSCSGTVLAAGDEVTEFRPGDRVACGGADYATHSEINFVPRNLAVKVPDSVPLDAAALTTLGAIAMQGVRQAQIAFGETVAIIGAGLIGVLAIQIARAAGGRVIALDTDAARAAAAGEFGALAGLLANDPLTPRRVRELSRYGVDAAIVTASSSSAEPLELAAGLLRDRGRISVVGAVGLGVSRSLMYEKELSLVLSRSYGPGRYDPAYEEGGTDYPIGYVRWTERRNMEAFLDLLASGAIDVARLIEGRFPVEQGAMAYAQLRNGKTYTSLIAYPSEPEPARRARIHQLAHTSADGIHVGCIGAGGFARGVIFPQLRAIEGVSLRSVASASGATAVSAQKSFGFLQAQTAAELIADPGVNAVFVLSRHDSHARYVIDAVKAHKPVFVEKPLAVSREELQAIREACEGEWNLGRSPFVMVGFNRRFAPATEHIRDFFAGRGEPMAVNVRVNAGFLPGEHWTQQPAGAGRIVGELCHFLDWARAVVGAPIGAVTARALPDGSRYHQDNVAVLVDFRDGSVASLLYLANGDRSVPKEEFEVFCEGAIARLHDFATLELVRQGRTRRLRCHHEKGHQRELSLTLAAIRSGAPAPIDFAEICEVTEATFAVRDALGFGLPVRLAELASSAHA